MKVRDLIEKLSECEMNAEVLVNDEYVDLVPIEAVIESNAKPINRSEPSSSGWYVHQDGEPVVVIE